MNVDLIFQIAGVGIVVAVINQLLTRAGRDEQALLIINSRTCCCAFHTHRADRDTV